MHAHGRDAVALAVGNPSAHKMGLLLYFAALAKALGTKNVFSASTLDQMPKQLSSGLMFGHWLSVPVPDIERCDFLLMLGANPVVSNGSLWTVPDFRGKAKALRARGGRMVVIDPRRTETAAVADEHHFIRPGADALPARRDGAHAVRRRPGAARAGSSRTWPASTTCAPPCSRSRPSAWPRAAASTPTRSAAWRASSPPRSAPASTAASAPARRASARWRRGWSTCSTCSPATSTNPAARCSRRPPPSPHNTAGKPGIGRGITTGRHTSRVSGAPEVFGELPMTLPGRGDRDPRAGPGEGADHGRQQPGALSARRPAPGRGARHARLHGQPGHLPQRDHAPRRRDPARLEPAGGQPLRRRASRSSRTATTRATAAPVFAPRPGHPPEWQTLLRLAAIALGRGAQADVLALDDELVDADVRKLAGEHTAAVMAAHRRIERPRTAARPGAAHRPLRRRLRPQARRPEPGQGAGRAGRHRPRRAAAARARSAAHAQRQGRTGARAAARRPAARAGRARRRTRAAGGDRPPRRAQQQQLDAQPAHAGQGPRTLHPARPPDDAAHAVWRRRTRAQLRGPPATWT